MRRLFAAIDIRNLLRHISYRPKRKPQRKHHTKGENCPIGCLRHVGNRPVQQRDYIRRQKRRRLALKRNHRQMQQPQNGNQRNQKGENRKQEIIRQ